MSSSQKPSEEVPSPKRSKTAPAADKASMDSKAASPTKEQVSEAKEPTNETTTEETATPQTGKGQIEMAIYGNNRIGNELRELLQTKGVASLEGNVSAEELFVFDQMHYHGVKSLDTCVELLAMKPGARVLDVGSGYGGPARYLVHKHKCKVTALELQADVNEQAAELTKLVALSDVHHVCGDVCELSSELESQFDHATALLCILHLPEASRANCFESMAKSLKPGGSIYIEDFFMHESPLSKEHAQRLAKVVSCPFAPTAAGYVQTLEAAGFTDVKFRDVTEDWAQYTNERSEAFRGSVERQTRVHGEKLTQSLDIFYSTMAFLLKHGLGGVVLTATKKAT